MDAFVVAGLLILLIARQSHFIASPNSSLLFFSPDDILPRALVSPFLSSSLGKKEQTWISSVIDCLVYNSPFYPSRGVRRWISEWYPPGGSLNTFYHLAATTLERIFISSSVLLSFHLASFFLDSSKSALVDSMDNRADPLYPCVRITGLLFHRASPAMCRYTYIVLIHRTQLRRDSWKKTPAETRNSNYIINYLLINAKFSTIRSSNLWFEKAHFSDIF